MKILRYSIDSCTRWFDSLTECRYCLFRLLPRLNAYSLFAISLGIRDQLWKQKRLKQGIRKRVFQVNPSHHYLLLIQGYILCIFIIPPPPSHLRFIFQCIFPPFFLSPFQFFSLTPNFFLQAGHFPLSLLTLVFCIIYIPGYFCIDNREEVILFFVYESVSLLVTHP